MLLVLVKQNGEVVGKEIYSGDTEGIQAELDKRSLEDVTLSFEIIDEKDKEIFEAISVAEKSDSPKSLWQIEKAKGTDAAIDFLAQKLGLE